MARKSRGIAFRLSLFVLVGVSVLFLLFGAINYQISRKILVGKLALTSDAITNEALTEIRNQLQAVQSVTTDIESILLAATGTDDSTIKIILRNYLHNLDGITGISLLMKDEVNDTANFRLSYYLKLTDTLVLREPYDSFDLGWYTDPFSTGKPTWTEPHKGILSEDQKTITYSMPFIEDGKIAGLLNTHVSLAWLDRVVDGLKVYESGFAFAISKSGTFLTHPNQKDFIGTRSLRNPEAEVSEEELNMLFEGIDSRKPGYVELTDQIFTGEKVFLMYRPLDVLEGTLLFFVPKGEVLSGLYQLSTLLLVVVFISFTLLVFVVFFVTRRMLAPLNVLSQKLMRIGEGDFDVEIPEYNKDDEIGNLRQSFLQMKEDLKKHVVLLDQSTSERDKIMTEISLAARIQQSIIPDRPPEKLNDKGFDIYGILKPAKQIGGDFYDFFIKDEKYLYFVIGDVMGKGIPASFFMGMARTFFRTESKYTSSANELLKMVNADLCLNNPEAIFVTAFCGVLDLKSGRVDYCNAGHNYPVLAGKQKNQSITEQHGTPLGLIEGQDYKSGNFILDHGESLVLYTDGITEARNSENEILGDERLLSLVEAINNKSNRPEDFAHMLVDEVYKFETGTEQTDDLTVLILKREVKN